MEFTWLCLISAFLHTVFTGQLMPVEGFRPSRTCSSFSHHVFKRLILQTHNTGFFWKGLNDWLIVCCLMPFSTVFQLYRTNKCFPEILLTSTLHHILSKPLAAFSRNHCQNIGQRCERYEICGNDLSILGKKAESGIKLATSRSQVRYATDWGMGGWGGGVWRLSPVWYGMLRNIKNYWWYNGTDNDCFSSCSW